MAGAAGTLQDEALVAAMCAELEAGRPFALATVLDAKGVVPRHPGARMACLADGRNLGTVGGGRVEAQARSAARELLAAGSGSRIVTLTNNGEGTRCAGESLVGMSVVRPDKLAGFADLLSSLKRREPVWFVEDWADEDAPAFSVARGLPELPVALPDGFPGYAWIDERWFVEAVAAIPRLFIFGAGHVGRALCPVAARVGFVPVVRDVRAELALAERFPEAESVACVSYEDPSLADDVTAEDYVVCCTHTHATEAQVLGQVLPRHPRYVGCLGSRKKAAFLAAKLAEAGVAEKDIARVRIPVGLAIGAVTPDEIAVAIAAELIQARSQAT
jgi:xanthine dehydrogenase accessory factor